MSKVESTVRVLPSILAANLLDLGSEIDSISAAGADGIHVDVMDGHFVPNLSFGLPLIRQLKQHTRLPLDVHIMVSNPDAVAMEYVHAGADCLAFHPEAAVHPVRILQTVRDAGCVPAIAINPGTAIELIEPLLPFADRVTLMSVNPGFGGQSFISNSIERIERIVAMYESMSALRENREYWVQVDGGVNADTVVAIGRAGANALVAGTYFFAADDRSKAVHELRRLAQVGC